MECFAIMAIKKGMSLMSLMTRKLLLSITAIVLFALTVKLAKFSYSSYKSMTGTETVIEGTIDNKQYVAAHQSSSWFLFFYDNNFYPEKYVFTIRRYDKNKKSWESADVDVDKDTYNKYKVNDNYKDKSGKTAFFHIDSKGWRLRDTLQ